MYRHFRRQGAEALSVAAVERAVPEVQEAEAADSVVAGAAVVQVQQHNRFHEGRKDTPC